MRESALALPFAQARDSIRASQWAEAAGKFESMLATRLDSIAPVPQQMRQLRMAQE